MLLIFSLLITLFAGCDTEQDTFTTSTDSVLTEDAQPITKPSLTPSEEPNTTEEPTKKPTQTPASNGNSSSNLKEIVFPVYPCGEKGEEVLELAKSLREKYVSKDGPGMVRFIALNYDYSEQDILYGVYHSGWEQKCSEIIEMTLKGQDYISKYNLLVELSRFPYIEKDMMSAIENRNIDWNEQAYKMAKDFAPYKKQKVN